MTHNNNTSAQRGHTMTRFEIDLVPNEVHAHARMDDDAARTIYFALCNERDKVVADIAKYHNFGATYYQECEYHPKKENFDPWCSRCLEVESLRNEGHKLEKNRDEDLMFLSDYLNKITAILFEMGANNTPEFDSWLSV